MPLLERSAEAEALGRMGAAARAGSGGVTLIEGEAGIGKSALLTNADHHGCLVLRGRAAAAERDFAYGGARQLRERHVRPAPEPEALFAGPASLARRLVGSGR